MGSRYTEEDVIIFIIIILIDAVSTPHSPLELVFFVPDVIGLVVVEELRDACGQVAVDAVHIAGRGHDGAHVFVAVLDTFLHLSTDKDLQLSQSTLTLMSLILSSSSSYLSCLLLLIQACINIQSSGQLCVYGHFINYQCLQKHWL